MTSRTTDDLREALRASSAAMPPGLDALADVQRRADRQRRRRWLGGALVLGAGAASVLLAVTIAGGNPTATPPTPPTHPSPLPTSGADVLPTYLRGGRLVASREAVDAHGVSMSFTPTSARVGFVLGCVRPASSGPRVTAWLTINGRTPLGVGCGSRTDPLGLSGDSAFGRDLGSADYGLVAGQPATVQLHFRRSEDDPGTRWRLAAYQAVPLVDYPFPPAPDQLAAFEPGRLYRSPGKRLVWNGLPPVRADHTTYTVPVTRGLTVLTQARAPGVWRMYVNDRLVYSFWSWSYAIEQGQASFTLRELGITPGERVTLRVTSHSKAPHSHAYAVYDSAR